MEQVTPEQIASIAGALALKSSLETPQNAQSAAYYVSTWAVQQVRFSPCHISLVFEFNDWVKHFSKRKSSPLHLIV